MRRKQLLMGLAVLGLVAALASPRVSRAAGPEPKLEQRFAIPLKGLRAGVQFPAWVGFDGAGRHLAAAYHADGLNEFGRPGLTVWDTRTAKVLLERRDLVSINHSKDRDFGLHAAFHPAGSHILTDGYLALIGDPLGAAKNPLHARTVDRGTARRKSMFVVGNRVIRHLTAYPDNTLYVDSLDPDAMRYDPADVRTAKSFAAGKKYTLDGPPALLAIDSGGARAAWAQRPSGDDEADVVRVLDLETAQSLRLESERPIRDVRCLTFSPDGRALAGGCSDGFVRLWAAENGRERWCVAVHEWTMGSAAFAPDGGLLVCGSLKNKDANLIFYQPETGKVVWAGAIEDGGVVGLAFGPTGDKLAVLAGHGVIYVYDVADLRKFVRKK